MNKTPSDLLATLTAEHSARSDAFIGATRDIGERFIAIADGQSIGAFGDPIRLYESACSDALLLVREAAALNELQRSINLARMVVKS